MDHDFNGMDQTKLKNNPSGNGKCKGIMDYTDSTGGWSECSNKDMKKYLNGLKKNCLKRKYPFSNILRLNLGNQPHNYFSVVIGTTGTSTDWSEGTPEGTLVPPGAGGQGCKPPVCIMEP